MCSPAPPPAPDYKGAAEATAEADLDMARLNTLANRPDEYGPEGSKTWEQDGDKWTSYTTLNPEAQKAYDSSLRMKTGLAGLGEQAVGQVGDLFSSRYKSPSEDIPDFGERRDSVYDAMMNRVNTDVNRDRESKSSQLIAQGIPPGSEAWNREMEMFDRRLTDAGQQSYINSTNQAIQEQNAEMDLRRQGIQEALMERQTPLNEISAFRTGSQVNIPQFQPYGAMPFTGGADYLNATNMKGQNDLAGYNAKVAGQNALMGGLFDIGAGLATGGTGFFKP